MLLVQEFLKSHSFKELQEQHGVYASFSNSGHKWSLNYDQLEVKNNDPLSQECRGLILSTHNGISLKSQAVMVEDRLKYDHLCPGKTVVLAFPMKRFFNHGQDCAAKIDWQDPKLSVFEKLDGTLTILYFDCFVNQWHVATRSVPEANLIIDNGSFTFRTLFEKAVKDTIGISFEEFTSKLDRSVTYCFELTSPYNRIVVKYDYTTISLLAARNIISLQELDIDQVETYNIPQVKKYTFSTIDKLLNWVSSQNPLEHEGIVVKDSHFNRVKAKNAAYVAFNRARDVLGSSDRNCLELILLNKEDDVIPALPPEIVKNLLSIKKKYFIWIKSQEKIYNDLIEDPHVSSSKKNFALTLNKKINKHIYRPAFFAVFDKKVKSIKDFIQSQSHNDTWSNGFLDRILSEIG